MVPTADTPGAAGAQAAAEVMARALATKDLNLIRDAALDAQRQCQEYQVGFANMLAKLGIEYATWVLKGRPQ